MDVILKGRGVRITDHLRRVAERKLGGLERIASDALRLEVEILDHRNPRLGGAHRIEAALETPRRTFRAAAEGPDVDGVLDRVADRLERQVREHRKKRRAKLLAGAGRVKSARAGGSDRRTPPVEEA
jgi:putative sigma-54 modulation protein